MPEERRVAIVFANMKGNLGDYAILHAMLDKIGKHEPAWEIDVYGHPLVGIDTPRFAAFKQLAPNFNIAGQTPTPPAPSFLGRLLSHTLRKTAQKHAIETFARTNRPAMEHFSQYEAIFVAGGDQWSGKQLGVAMFGTLSALCSINPNILAFPFSVKASILNLYDRAVLHGLFSHLRQPIIARDSLSKNILDQVGLSVTQGTDCVFSLHETARNIAIQPERNPDRILIVVKGKEPDLAKTLSGLVGRGLALELLTTCPPEDGNTYQALSSRFDIPYRAPMTWQEIVAEFKASRLIVTNRLHGLILGSLAEAPLLPVADRKKALAFVRDADMPHHVVSAMNLTPEIIETTAADRTLVLSRMRGYLNNNRAQPHSPLN